MAQDVRSMKKRKKVDLHDVQVTERIKLAWEVRRQVQQEILQKKLVQCFLKPYKGRKCIQRYPEAMQPMIKDFMRKAEEQTRLYRA
jgi:BarA-like signal transduction histidine kinase